MLKKKQEARLKRNKTVELIREAGQHCQVERSRDQAKEARGKIEERQDVRMLQTQNKKYETRNIKL